MMRTPKDKRVADLVKYVKDFANKTDYEAVVLANVKGILHIATTNSDIEDSLNSITTGLLSVLERADDTSANIQVAALILQSANIIMDDEQVAAMRNTLARLDKEKANSELPKSNLRLI